MHRGRVPRSVTRPGSTHRQDLLASGEYYQVKNGAFGGLFDGEHDLGGFDECGGRHADLEVEVVGGVFGD